MLLEAASLLIEVDKINKEVEAMGEPYVWLKEKKDKVDAKVRLWLDNNIVETD